MKFDITKWITTGNIAPLSWGTSANEIEQVFKGSSQEIQKLRAGGCPFIIMDFVEFYFDRFETYEGLNEIVIKPIALYKGVKNMFFTPNWLSAHLTLTVVAGKLDELGVDWKIERGPLFNTPNILTSSNILFAFDSEDTEDSEAELLKIYLRRQDSSQLSNIA